MNTTNPITLFRDRHQSIIDLRKSTIDKPLHVYVTSLLFLTLVAVCIGWVVMIWQDVPASNLFSEYTTVFPGHSLKQALAEGFHCSQYYRYWDQNYYCSLFPATGPFERVSLETSNGIVNSATFSTRDNAINVGDLSLLWGRPKTKFLYELGIFMWPTVDSVAYSLTTNGQFSFYQPVDQIIFTANQWSK